MSRPPKVVLSFGLGVDSTAIVLRLLTDPSCRDFPLSDLVVITAQTGDEWRRTGELVERHIYPRLAAAGVRTIQVARTGRHKRDGVTVLADTRAPGRVFLNGVYRLSEEMLAAGTVPQLGGVRKCSQRAKGVPLDATIAAITQGHPYRHIVGFECHETGRATRDRGYDTTLRAAEYPLIDWGWDRTDCEGYIAARLGGIAWPKSACTYCPFALANQAGRARTLDGFAADPAAAVTPLLMEFVANALNPRQALMADARLLDLIRAEDRFAPAWAAFRAAVQARDWAIYDVRRVRRATAGGGRSVLRSVRALATGDLHAMRARLATVAERHGQAPSALAGTDRETGREDVVDGHRRIWLPDHGIGDPDGGGAREHFIALAPATAEDKRRPSFDDAWERATAATESSSPPELW